MFKTKLASSKPALSEQFWAIQVLTTDYLIDGTFHFQPEEDKLYSSPYYFFRGLPEDNDAATLDLTVVQFQPTSPSAIAPTSPTLHCLVYLKSLVALIPHDEASAAHVANNNPAQDLVAADVYVGAYVIHGTILIPETDMSDLSIYHSFVVQDAEIEYRLSGAQLKQLQASFVIVRTQFLQGIALRT